MLLLQFKNEKTQQKISEPVVNKKSNKTGNKRKAKKQKGKGGK